MARVARERSSTGIYHVMLRGINQQTIFEDDQERVRLSDDEVKDYIRKLPIDVEIELAEKHVITV